MTVIKPDHACAVSKLTNIATVTLASQISLTTSFNNERYINLHQLPRPHPIATTMSDLTIKNVAYSHKDACLLRDAQQLEISDLRPIGPGVQATSANVSIFLIAYDANNEPVGCGGLRPLVDQGLPGQAEVKRMYVVPSRRSAGGGDSSQGTKTSSVALSILDALERAASEHEFRVLKIETSKGMPQARRFYEKHGYLPCEVFGGYRGSEHSICYEKVLV